MGWASQPTTGMPADLPPPTGPRWSRRRVVASAIAVGGLAAVAIAALLVTGLFGSAPPGGTAAPGEPESGGGVVTESRSPAAPGASPGTAQPTPLTVYEPVSLEAEVFALTNAERTGRGCPALRLDPNLAAAARAHSTEMARTGVLGHPGPDGIDVGERLRRAGYDIGGGWAENIAYGQATAADVVTAWLRSTEHRGNILNCSLRAVGIGAAHDMSGQIYWTQDFGGR